MTSAVPAPDLAATTLRLIDVPSESRSEAEIVGLVRELMPGSPATSRAGSPTAPCTAWVRAT